MLRLHKVEIEGFGPFAETEVIDLPLEPGVTVIYGKNMLGKTSTLSALRFAFLGSVLGRGSKERGINDLSNRKLAEAGRYGFKVRVAFDYDGERYELTREARPVVEKPTMPGHYDVHVMLRQGGNVVGPDVLKTLLVQILPYEVARFFLFDGELLQEYEELLIKESGSGKMISDAIEKILGVPILTKAVSHLSLLSENAARQEGKEATRNQSTAALGIALQQSVVAKEAHKKELESLSNQLEDLESTRLQIEGFLREKDKFKFLLGEKEAASERLGKVKEAKEKSRIQLKDTMSESWRSLLREPVAKAISEVEAEVSKSSEEWLLSLRQAAIALRHCQVCEQDVSSIAISKLSKAGESLELEAGLIQYNLSQALGKLSKLQKFSYEDRSMEVNLIWKDFREKTFEEIELSDKISEVDSQVSESDSDLFLEKQVRFSETNEKIGVLKSAVYQCERKVENTEMNIQEYRKKIEQITGLKKDGIQEKANVIRAALEVFRESVERYKQELRKKVEASATDLFLKMTTEKREYAGLEINQAYGLNIKANDGIIEVGRSAGAEHVVALSLMGALQRNAPLRGPIVMDTPFGRLDEDHLTNVISTLPSLADQVILLVHEKEVGGRANVRRILGAALLREYELEKVNIRHTKIRRVK